MQENNHDSEMIRAAIASSIKGLPALPTAVIKVLEETSKADPDANKIQEYISADQALAAKLLRVVNSAYYGLSRQVTNIGQAAVILGLQQVRNLTLGVGAASCFNGNCPEAAERLSRFWLHSFATGSTAVAIGRAKRLESSTVEILFTAGLLHDIGRLFLFSNFVQTYDAIFATSAERQVPVEAIEIEYLGLNHAEIGGLIAEKWNLPATLVDVIRAHENPVPGKSSNGIWAVHVADMLNKHHYGAEGYTYAMDDAALEWLNFSDAQLAELLEDVNLKTNEAASMFNVLAA